MHVRKDSGFYCGNYDGRGTSTDTSMLNSILDRSDFQTDAKRGCIIIWIEWGEKNKSRKGYFP